MTHLFSIMLLLLLVPQNQKLPDAFHQLPEDVQEKATVIFAGLYDEGRGPCITLPNGTRRWALESWFNVRQVYRGKVGGTVYINSGTLPKINEESVKLKAGRYYLVLLRPNEESMKAIKIGEYVPIWKALYGEEILAIVDLDK